MRPLVQHVTQTTRQGVSRDHTSSAQLRIRGLAMDAWAERTWTRTWTNTTTTRDAQTEAILSRTGFIHTQGWRARFANGIVSIAPVHTLARATPTGDVPVSWRDARRAAHAPGAHGAQFRTHQAIPTRRPLWVWPVAALLVLLSALLTLLTLPLTWALWLVALILWAPVWLAWAVGSTGLRLAWWLYRKGTPWRY